MKAGESVQPDHAIKLGKGLLGSLRSREIIPSGEGMSRVEADLQPLGILHTRENRRNLLEACPQTSTLSGCGLEGDAYHELRMFGMKSVEITNHAGGTGLNSSAEMRAWMEDQGADAKLLAAQHFVGERFQGLFVILGTLDPEIDQISGMSHHCP